jgi:hypothetical protein
VLAIGEDARPDVVVFIEAGVRMNFLFAFLAQTDI